MRLPRRELETRSGDRLEGDLKIPKTSKISLCLYEQFLHSGKWGAYNTNIPILRCYPLVCFRFQQLASNELLQGEHDSVLAPYSDSCTAILHCLDRIFDLEL